MGPSTILDTPPVAPLTAGRPRDRLAATALANDVARLHGDALLRTARRYAGDPDDAHDAYQRALELLLEHAATIDRAKALGWMHVVVRREAVALRRRHDRHLPFDVDAVDVHQASDRTDEHLQRIDLAQRAGEALATLKDSEAQALCLRAQGLSYEEIGATYGWTYTKVNRAVSEGRKAFAAHYLGAERGDICEQTADRLDAYVAGELRPRDHLRFRAHLSRCSACRAELHATRTADAALRALLPPVAVVAAPKGSWLHDHVLGPLADLATRLTPAADHAVVAKLGVAAASIAAVTGSGLTIDHQLSKSSPLPAVRTVLVADRPAGTPTRSSTALSVPADALTTAADAGERIVVSQRERAAAAAARAKRAATARRKAAATRRARQRSAAAREFSPATSEFSGTTTQRSASAATRQSGATSDGASSAGTSASPSVSDAPIEVPADAGGADPGITVTDTGSAP